MNHQDKAIELLTTYVGYASVSTDPAYAEGMKGAREFIADQYARLGFSVEIVETAGHPIVLAERGSDRPGSENWPHLLLYGHYDVQPPDPLGLWVSPPFQAEVRGDRIYGRGAADNKGPQVLQILALEQLFQQYPDLPIRLTLLIEGEEEMGSPSFRGFLEKHGKRLAQADFFFITDTGGPSADQLVVTTQLRGLCELQVQVKGPKMDLHSGLYGGAVRNPIEALTRICASLHHPDGTVNVPGFYDGIVPAETWEKEELLRLPMTEETMQQLFEIPAFRPTPGYTVAEAIRFQPTLEFNGIGGGYQGAGAKTIIPSEAFVKITCRLVPNQNPESVSMAVRQAVEARCPPGVTVRVTQGPCGWPYLVVPPHRPNTPSEQPAILARAFTCVDSAVKAHFGRQPLYLRQGGSIPIIAELKRETGRDSLMLGFYTPEDYAHAPNESFHLGIMEKGIRVMASIIRDIADPKGPAG